MSWRTLHDSMDPQYYLRVFDSEMFPVTRCDSKLIFALVFKSLNNLVTRCREHTYSTDVRIFNLLNPNLAYGLSWRHLPSPIWILLPEDGRVCPISKLDLYRCNPTLSVLDAQAPDLHAKHGTFCLTASVNMFLCRPSKPNECAQTLYERVLYLAWNSRFRSRILCYDEVRQVLSLIYATNIKQVDRCDGFVDRFLGCSQRFE